MTSGYPGTGEQTLAVRFVDTIADWDGKLPVALIGPARSGKERRATLKALVAHALSVCPDLVDIEHRPDRRPIVTRPDNSGLFLSMASRAALGAVAVAMSPVGADIEIVEPEAEIPWRVLHPEEVAMLRRLSGQQRAMAFTRLWTLKEAYLKALRVGFEREPSSFVVRFEGETATIADTARPAEVADARTAWRQLGGSLAAIAIVTLQGGLS